METLHTERLTLSPCTIDDAAFLLALLNSPGWLKYIGDRNVHTLEEARSYMQNRIMKAYEKDDYGMWLVRDTTTGAAMGLCGIVVRDTLPHPDLGFAFLPEFQGKGFAFEAAQAVMEFAIGYTDIDTMLAIATPDNTHSIKLLTKLGMSFESEFTDPDTKDLLVRYSINLNI